RRTRDPGADEHDSAKGFRFVSENQAFGPSPWRLWIRLTYAQKLGTGFGSRCSGVEHPRILGGGQRLFAHELPEKTPARNVSAKMIIACQRLTVIFQRLRLDNPRNLHLSIARSFQNETSRLTRCRSYCRLCVNLAGTAGEDLALFDHLVGTGIRRPDQARPRPAGRGYTRVMRAPAFVSSSGPVLPLLVLRAIA